ncbi:hypothetical protein J2S21_001419 [Peribacillus cavernae]|nr:hypothetical protein [Peribacillus cavernae]
MKSTPAYTFYIPPNSGEDVFTIYNIGLGDSRAEVEKLAGASKRSTINEYGVKWDTYHKNYQHFFMAAYDKNNKVAGLYTNQDLIASTKGIKRGAPKESVLAQLGVPLTKFAKAWPIINLRRTGTTMCFESMAAIPPFFMINTKIIR